VARHERYNTKNTALHYKYLLSYTGNQQITISEQILSAINGIAMDFAVSHSPRNDSANITNYAWNSFQHKLDWFLPSKEQKRKIPHSSKFQF